MQVPTMIEVMAHSSPPHISPKGFTLIETMVVVALMSVLAALAIPSMQSAFDRYRVNAVYDELRSTYVFARSEAIRTRQRVNVDRVATNLVVCPTTADWQCGWVVYVDANGNGTQETAPAAPAIPEPTLRAVPLLSGGTTLITFKPAPIGQIAFDRWGNITPLGAFRQVIAPSMGIASPNVQTLCASSGGRFRSVKDNASAAACAAAQ